jgi:tRNA G18 (ribose-2'-O)-methylase SpoU
MTTSLAHRMSRPPIHPIADPADPRIADYLDIRERDLVGRRRKFVAEGEVVLRSLLGGRSRFAVESVLIAGHRVGAQADLLALVPADVPIYAAAQEVLDRIAGFHLHRGLLAIGRRGADPPLADFLAGLPAIATTIVAVGIANHDNVGGIFRNAAAFGAAAVLLDAGSCDPLYRKAIRVSAGACLTVPFVRQASGAEILDALAAAGFAALALSPAGAEPLHKVTPAARTALVVGAEGSGLPTEILARCRTIAIPMAAGTDSLNVATAAAIALYGLAEARPRRP